MPSCVIIFRINCTAFTYCATKPSHITNNNLIERNQSAYCQYHSTETVFLHITNCLLESTDQGRVSILTLLDLSAAFDTLDHSILLHCLNVTFGMSVSALQVHKITFGMSVSALQVHK